MPARPRPHDYFTEEEWVALDRVTRRWSDAGRAIEQIQYPASWETLRAIYEEDREAAAEYHATLQRILAAAGPGRGRSG